MLRVKIEQKEICEQRALHPAVLNLPLSDTPLDTHHLSSQIAYQQVVIIAA